MSWPPGYLDNDQFWDRVVGIPLDDWLAATTTEQVQELIRRRDSGYYTDRPLEEGDDWIEIRSWEGQVVRRLPAYKTH